VSFFPHFICLPLSRTNTARNLRASAESSRRSCQTVRQAIDAITNRFANASPDSCSYDSAFIPADFINL